jgi:hypothetical protein
MKNDPEKMLTEIISRFNTDRKLIDNGYGNSDNGCGDGDHGYLFPRLMRAALNQCSDGDATISRYAIWADTVGDHISDAMHLMEKGEKEDCKRLLIAAYNSLGAFSAIQMQLDPLSKATEPQSLDRLIDMGFKRAGIWELNGDKIKYNLESCSDLKNVLYSFVCDNSVMYIGKTTQLLKKRMYGYQNPNLTQSTNIKGNKFITELVSSGKVVEIYALPDNGLLHYGGFHVNIAAGLEDNLVSALKPVWNKMGI